MRLVWYMPEMNASFESMSSCNSELSEMPSTTKLAEGRASLAHALLARRSEHDELTEHRVVVRWYGDTLIEGRVKTYPRSC